MTNTIEQMTDKVIEDCINEGILNSTVQHIKQTTSFHKVAEKGILLGMEHTKRKLGEKEKRNDTLQRAKHRR